MFFTSWLTVLPSANDVMATEPFALSTHQKIANGMTRNSALTAAAEAVAKKFSTPGPAASRRPCSHRRMLMSM